MANIKALTQRLDQLYEFDREPVTTDKLHSPGKFAALFAGEHVAATEFVIGPMFVLHGVAAKDLFLGLLIGNFLAVLSWAFIVAPIAVRTRLTLYWYLRKIGGPGLTYIYNVANALLYCILAGAMISVSATAVGLAFNIPTPALTDVFPNSVGWVLITLLVGSVVTVIAILGFDKVSKFSSVCAPWLFAIFIAGALAMLPSLGEIRSLSDFWHIAETKIWNGIAAPGQEKYTFWHITFFAWFCNMAMHIGMSDLSILRYAKKWYYGTSVATGVYLGHYIAWIASGILYSLFLMESNYSTEFAPGPVAFRAAGIAGAICVIIAGWTTANPTIYRAGLALQSIRPKWKTWKVTMVIGMITSFAALFPALVMKLLEFVAIYGLLLMPMGAVIFLDVYVLPRIGLKSDYAATFNKKFNIAAAIAWILCLAICLFINLYFGMEVFFLGLPGWFIAAILYLVFSKLIQGNLQTKGV